LAGFAAKVAAKQDALRSLGEGWRRLAKHNAGKSAHASKFIPWKLVTYITLSEWQRAETFERYLKSGSGHASARKRLW
jgi:hypothetical protein